MSTLVYAQLTTKREESPPGTSMSQSPPGVKTYVDVLAALVPAEVLALHGLILSVTTKTDGSSTIITEPNTLACAFLGLLLLSIGMYVVPRVLKKKKEWDKLDYFRMLIPPLALIGWTMLQRATAFDAVFPSLNGATRTVIALFLAVILGAGAANLANKADQKQP